MKHVKNSAKIFVVAGWKYEPEWLVEDMKENMSWADQICIVDTRNRRSEYWIHEGEYRMLQRKALENAGIQDWDWVFVTSPDERLERRASYILRQLIKEKKKAIYSFNLKEMFTPNKYRIDGIWGRKARPRLYPYLKKQRFSRKRIQQAPTPRGNYDKLKVDLNIYHLKMIEPANRTARADAYKKTDPNYRFQRKTSRAFEKIDPEGKFKKLGYDYLSDTEGMKLEVIPKGREYSPLYNKKYIFNPDA